MMNAFLSATPQWQHRGTWEPTAWLEQVLGAVVLMTGW